MPVMGISGIRQRCGRTPRPAGTRQVPILMLSARHNESTVVEGLKCGANAYVTKPFRWA